MSSSKKATILAALALCSIALYHLFLKQDGQPADGALGDMPQENKDGISEPQGQNDMPPLKAPPISEDLSHSLMKDYGAVNKTGLDDIFRNEELLQSYFALIKVDDPLPMGENSEITAALGGRNPYRIRFLNPDSPWINDQGELVDRWGTAVYFHPIDLQRVGVRSAGPDKKLWTADDITNGEDAEPLSPNVSNPRMRR